LRQSGNGGPSSQPRANGSFGSKAATKLMAGMGWKSEIIQTLSCLENLIGGPLMRAGRDPIPQTDLPGRGRVQVLRPTTYLSKNPGFGLEWAGGSFTVTEARLSTLLWRNQATASAAMQTEAAAPATRPMFNFVCMPRPSGSTPT